MSINPVRSLLKTEKGSEKNHKTYFESGKQTVQVRKYFFLLSFKERKVKKFLKRD